MMKKKIVVALVGVLLASVAGMSMAACHGIYSQECLGKCARVYPVKDGKDDPLCASICAPSCSGLNTFESALKECSVIKNGQSVVNRQCIEEKNEEAIRKHYS